MNPTYQTLNRVKPRDVQAARGAADQATLTVFCTSDLESRTLNPRYTFDPKPRRPSNLNNCEPKPSLTLNTKP